MLRITRGIFLSRHVIFLSSLIQLRFIEGEITIIRFGRLHFLLLLVSFIFTNTEFGDLAQTSGPLALKSDRYYPLFTFRHTLGRKTKTFLFRGKKIYKSVVEDFSGKSSCDTCSRRYLFSCIGSGVVLTNYPSESETLPGRV